MSTANPANHADGFTLIELITVTLIITVLAAAAIPLAQTAIQREREIDLRRSLRLMRTAIDEYKKFTDENKIEMDEDRYGYPEKLDDLVKGLTYTDKEDKKQIKKFLRAIPFDPITRSYEWGLRSVQDKRESTSWGGENVWDVYCKSEKKALDGTAFEDW